MNDLGLLVELRSLTRTDSMATTSIGTIETAESTRYCAGHLRSYSYKVKGSDESNNALELPREVSSCFVGISSLKSRSSSCISTSDQNLAKQEARSRPRKP